MGTASAHDRLWVFALLTVAVFVLGSIPTSSGAAASGVQAVSVTLQSGSSVSVISPLHTNLSLLSVRGPQYSVSLGPMTAPFGAAVNGVPVRSQSLLGGEEFSFTPLNASTYSIELNISSSRPTFALVSQGGPTGALVKNVTSTGSFELDLNLTATPAPQQSPGWNPLFGLTGIALTGFGTTSEDGVILASILLVTLFGLGVKYNRKFLGLGALLLLAVGVAVVGLIIETSVILIYIASFVAVRTYFRMKTKYPKTEGGTK